MKKRIGALFLAFVLMLTPNMILVAEGGSNPATKATVIEQPKDANAKVGETVEFTVLAEGDGLTYRWQYKIPDGSWKNSGATGHDTATLTIGATAARNGYQYRCVVVDQYGNKAISKGATLTIKPAITSQPTGKTAKVGESVKFTVKATGAGLTYRWQYKTPDGSWKNSGATGHNAATLTISATAARNGYQYRCVVVDANGKKLISSAATLKIKTTITGQPKSVSVTTGTVAKFTVTATGAGLSYQWQFKKPDGSWTGSGASGAKTSALSVTTTLGMSGNQYRCVITDANGSKTYSSAATLTVADPTPVSGTVYWAETGTKYHTHRDCRSLANSDVIYSGTVEEAVAAGHLDLCKICAGR